MSVKRLFNIEIIWPSYLTRRRKTLLGFNKKINIKKGLALLTVISLSLSLGFSLKLRADIAVGGDFSGGTASDISNNNQIQLQNASQNLNQTQVNSYSRAGIISAPGGGGSNTVIGSPSAFANTHLFNAPWNFTPPNILFHCSKTINDNSAFGACRIINIGAGLRRGIKDRLFGIYDEREFIASGSAGGGAFKGGAVIACGLDTSLPSGCVNYIGTGYVFMEEYGTSEAALVALSRMAARNGGNIVGNVNCGFAETIRSYSTSLGAAVGFSDGIGQSGAASSSIGANWGTSRVKRPAQPHCSADFYSGNPSSCATFMASNMVSNQTYFPQPVTYRRYLPPAQVVQQVPPQQPPVKRIILQVQAPPNPPPVMQMAPQPQPIFQGQPIRGLW
jgi:hypothetical protein